LRPLPRFPLKLRSRSVLATLLLGALSLFALVVIILVAAGIGSTRSFIVDAQTTAVTISFRGSTNDWALGPATICLPQRLDSRRARGDGLCDSRRYLEHNETDLRLTWPAGSEVRVFSSAAGRPVLTLLSDGPLPKDTRILLPKDALTQLGALSFYGHARIGQPVVSGEQQLLLLGTYEARERPFWSRNTEVLRSGMLRRGESVEILRDGTADSPPALQFGHISAEPDGTLGFHVSIASEAGKPVLRLVNYGGISTTTLAPSWIDRALNSTLILALALLLSLAVNFGQFLVSALELLARTHGEPSTGSTHNPLPVDTDHDHPEPTA
jgi:hypothetical protein